MEKPIPADDNNSKTEKIPRAGLSLIIHITQGKGRQMMDTQTRRARSALGQIDRWTAHDQLDTRARLPGVINLTGDNCSRMDRPGDHR